MEIKIVGARENNLKNISVTIPRNKLVVITGVSGSGKSSLAFDTVFAAAQRDYLESMSSYARQHLPKISAPNVDSIEGLSPVVLLDQKPLARNPRSTVGTVSEIYTYLRLLYSRLSNVGLSAGDFSFNNPSGACPTCTGLGIELSPDLDRLLDWGKSINDGAILHRTWKVGSRYWNIIRAINLFDIDKPLKEFTQDELDVLLYSEPQQYQNNDAGYIQSFSFEGVVSRLLKRQRDSRGQAGKSYDQSFFSPQTCTKCRGARLNQRAMNARVDGKSIVDWVTMELQYLLPYTQTIKDPLAESILPYIREMLGHLIDVGLGYLTLSRSVASLSGGEAQRLKLARQLGSSLIEMIYILDEPTVGLHPREVNYLSKILRQIVDKGNTVIVVEHERSIMAIADHIVDIGPGAGTLGGKVVAQGTIADIIKSNSITGLYLSHSEKRQQRGNRRDVSAKIEVRNARLNNLKNITVHIPQNALTCITGVSGAGKSSLVNVLVNRFPKIIEVDQSPPGTSSRSNPATYTKLLNPIRKVFSSSTGQNASLFTFNSDGACPKCNGLGYISIDLHFLGSFDQKCDECNGKGFNDRALKFKYRGKSISDVLEMTVKDAELFFDEPSINSLLSLLSEVGLEYLRLGQPLNSLSGGEAQRIKLVSYLGKKGNVFVLDEPTKGLHFADIERLLAAINRLANDGNTIVVVEHNLDVIQSVDWVIDLGPEGGEKGGELIYEGSPELLLKNDQSYTAKYLNEMTTA